MVRRKGKGEEECRKWGDGEKLQGRDTMLEEVRDRRERGEGREERPIYTALNTGQQEKISHVPPYLHLSALCHSSKGSQFRNKKETRASQELWMC